MNDIYIQPYEQITPALNTRTYAYTKCMYCSLEKRIKLTNHVKSITYWTCLPCVKRLVRYDSDIDS